MCSYCLPLGDQKTKVSKKTTFLTNYERKNKVEPCIHTHVGQKTSLDMHLSDQVSLWKIYKLGWREEDNM